MPGSVWVVGSINQDITFVVDRAPGAGETIHASSHEFSPGGKGANQAVASALAAVPTTMIGCVGEDGVGHKLVEYLVSRGVRTSVRVVPGATGAAAILVDASGENRIAVSAGANARLTPADIAERLNPSPGDVVVLQHETPVSVRDASISRARERGAVAVLNAAPPAALPQGVVDQIDLLVVNEHELAACLGRTVPTENCSLDQIAGELAAITDAVGCGIVLTLGARGAVAAACGERSAVPGERVDAVDTTGAGDCFVGTLAALLAKEAAGSGLWPLEQAMRRANAAAAASVRRRGASISFQPLDAI